MSIIIEAVNIVGNWHCYPHIHSIVSPMWSMLE